MTQIETIIAEIERLKHYGAIPYDKDAFKSVCLIESFINSITAEKPSEDLEKVSKNYADNEEYGDDAYFAIKAAFIAGANWQKQQTINKACEWLNKNVVEYHPRKGELRPIVNINAFREAMEKEDEQ